MDEIQLLEKVLNISSAEYSAVLDDAERIITLDLYDQNEYMPFSFRGNLIAALSPFKSLQNLSIDLAEVEITDISGLGEFIDLTQISLSNCRVTEISILGNLPHLTHISFNNAGIKDIEPLKNLKNLQLLNLSNNQITNVEVLSGHQNLLYVNLAYNELSDVSALADSKNITSLYIGHNQIANLDFVAEFNRLENLMFEYNAVTDIQFIAQLQTLKRLGFSGNPVTDGSPLANLHSLIQLSMLNIAFTDIKVITNLVKLLYFEVSGLEAIDTNIISRIDGLISLTLDSCGISDLSFLLPLTKLTYLKLSNNNISDCTPLYKLNLLENINLQNNQISTPFSYLPFDRLNSLDLTANPFGNKLYKGLSFRYLDKLNEDTADYWFACGEDDKALGHYYLGKFTKTTLLIYYRKLSNLKSNIDYLRHYYVMCCFNIIYALRETDEDIYAIRLKLIGIIEKSTFFNKGELLRALVNGMSVDNRYIDIIEYTVYLFRGGKRIANPELMCKIAENLSKGPGSQNNIELLFSIYKQLIAFKSDLNIRLQQIIYKQLVEGSYRLADKRVVYEHYRRVLLNPDEYDIPFFDHVKWLKDNYQSNIQIKNIVPASKSGEETLQIEVTSRKKYNNPNQTHHLLEHLPPINKTDVSAPVEPLRTPVERSYPEINTGKVILRIFAVIFLLLIATRSCRAQAKYKLTTFQPIDHPFQPIDHQQYPC